jgi:hypothetical protein
MLPPEPALMASEAHPPGPAPAPRAVESHLSAAFYAAPTPAPATIDRTSPPTTSGPGERALRVTYNTLLFGGLVALGVVFLAFTLGVRTGRSKAEAALAAPEVETAAPSAPAGPAPTFTILLVEYRARTSQEYTKALDAAIRYKNELERLGLREGVVETIGVTPDRRVVLRYGEFADAAAAPARETLKKLQGLKLDKGAREGTFARTAQFRTK